MSLPWVLRGDVSNRFASGDATARIARVGQTARVARDAVSIMPVRRLWDQQDRHLFPNAGFCLVGTPRSVRNVPGWISDVRPSSSSNSSITR